MREHETDYELTGPSPSRHRRPSQNGLLLRQHTAFSILNGSDRSGSVSALTDHRRRAQVTHAQSQARRLSICFDRLSALHYAPPLGSCNTDLGSLIIKRYVQDQAGRGRRSFGDRYRGMFKAF